MRSDLTGVAIAILLPDLRGGGVERIRLVLAREFLRAGYEVEFVLMKACGDLLADAQDEFLIHDLGCSRMREVPFALARYLRDRRPDVLLAAMWPLTVIAPLSRLIARHRCCIVVSEHCTLSSQYGSWGIAHRALLRLSIALGYRLADACVGVSDGVVDDIAKLSRVARGRFTRIHNPIAFSSASSASAMAQAEEAWRGADRGTRVLTVGSLKSQKNHSLLLRAMSHLSESRPMLMILGQGDSELMLRRLAEELGVADRVIFAGFHPDPIAFYGTADLFVLSSDYEGFGNVIVEALSMGLPIVSTDCPSGPAEILENGRWGRLVPVGDAKYLAQAIDRALRTAHNPAVLRRRAEDFAPEIAAREYLKLCEGAGCCKNPKVAT